MNLSDTFYQYWHASHAISSSRYDRMIYCKKRMIIAIPDLLEKYFDGSNKAFWNWIEDQLN
jgi:hypothetical protein